MKLILLQENLQHALNYIQKAIPSKAQLPILSSIVISVTTNSCTLGATDLYFGVKVQLSAQTDSSGTITVPGKEFKEIIGSLPAGEVTLEYVDSKLTITTGKTTCSIQCPDSSEYPQFPQVSGLETVLKISDIDAIAATVLYSASLDQARPLLTGILFDCKPEGIRAVATDGFRLSVYDCPANDQQQPIRFILPVRAMVEVCRIALQLKSETVTFTVSESLKQVFITFDTIEIYVRMLEGEYPPYEKIMPATFTTEVLVASDELLEQVKRASIFSRESSNIIQIEVSDTTVIVKAHSTTLGSFSGETTTAKTTGPGLTIAFKSKYLLDFLQASKNNEIWIGLNDSLKPALLKTQQQPNLRYIVMPFRISG
ncbi:DNA polymerase III subunit beta [Candidatus Woesebacteria bacterium]|nr:DNA polymerase III subunit beta [Candidatus Woesebacteria bacterium]